MDFWKHFFNFYEVRFYMFKSILILGEVYLMEVTKIGRCKLLMSYLENL